MKRYESISTLYANNDEHVRVLFVSVYRKSREK